MANSANPPQKPTDLDLHCLQRQGLFGFSRTRVKFCTSKFKKKMTLANSVYLDQTALEKTNEQKAKFRPKSMEARKFRTFTIILLTFSILNSLLIPLHFLLFNIFRHNHTHLQPSPLPPATCNPIIIVSQFLYLSYLSYHYSSKVRLNCMPPAPSYTHIPPPPPPHTHTHHRKTTHTHKNKKRQIIRK